MLVAATDGNHGRAVAASPGSAVSARISSSAGVHPSAVAAITAEGTAITRTGGTYEAAVTLAAEHAAAGGGLLVQDMAWPGYEQIPAWIVAGYATMFAEIEAQLAAAAAAPPGLVAVPVGVGSLLRPPSPTSAVQASSIPRR